MCAKCAIEPIEKEESPKNRSIKINKGTKYFALTGIGGNSSISLELGKENAKATRTP